MPIPAGNMGSAFTTRLAMLPRRVRLRSASTLGMWLVGLIPAAAMVGGATPVNDVATRSVVMITSSRGSLCTGTALTRDLILTAAHCVAPAASYIVLPAKGAAPLASKTISLHPRYDAKSYAANRATADVALIKLANTLPAPIVPAALDRRDKIAAVGDRFVIFGFGVTKPGSEDGIGVARTASLVATGQPGTLQVRLFDPATRGEVGGLGACTGDSGGPALRYDDGRLVVTGIVSWSTGPKLSAGCGGLTGVTPLVRYRDWVVEAASKLGSPLSP